MQKRERKRQLHHRILFTVFIVLVLSRPVLAKESRKVERGGYWMDSQTFVTEYTIPAVYKGECMFEDIEGNLREYHRGQFRKGKSYILYMSDCGTEDMQDDCILGIE